MPDTERIRIWDVPIRIGYWLLGLFVVDVDGLHLGPLSHLVSFGMARDIADDRRG